MEHQLIAIEGLDYSGKSTILQKLKKDHPDWIFAHEPGGTKISNEIAKIIKVYGKSMNVETKLALLTASRHELIQNVILPKLKETTVVLDRFVASTLVYQHYGDGIEWDTVINNVNNITFKLPPIDKTYYLDIDIDTMKKRKKTRLEKNDSLDNFNDAYYQRIKENYINCIKKTNTNEIIIIDGKNTEETVYNEINRTLEY